MIELIDGKQHQVIKRNGTHEDYDSIKMYKVLLWASDGNEVFARDLLKSINIRVFDKIHISKLFDQVIEATANQISEMYPSWDIVARNLFKQKIYKEVWGIKRSEYPNYMDVLKKGIKYKVYSTEVLDTFSSTELQELGEYIDQTRDDLFTFGGLNLFMQKYVAKYTKNRILELPQHAMMRVAIQLHFNSTGDRMQEIKDKYDLISNHTLAIPTPIYLNSLKQTFNPTSCVLIQADDDSESLVETARSMAIYSKNASGLGVDVSRIRSIGSTIGIDGASSGVIPFIQFFEAVVKSWNQKSARIGAGCIYYPWWTAQTPEIIMLKDAGGQDSERARALKYAIKWNSYFSDAIRNDEIIYLFDPKDAPELIEAVGDDFKYWYNVYKDRADKRSIRKKTMLAKDLAFLYLKIYAETGNNYWMNHEAANKFRVSSGHINMSNLCMEVMLSTEPLKLTDSKLSSNIGDNTWTETREYSGEIGICNLSNINLINWTNMSPEIKNNTAYNILVGLDNAIESSYYPVKAGERFNKKHRSVGVGVTNYQNWLATLGIQMSSGDALKKTHQILEEVSWYLTKNSIQLSKERGRYEYFEGSLWSKGIFQHELYKEHFESLGEEATHLNYDLNYDWEPLREDMVKYGVRFENLMAIAPGATSSLVFNFTESTEPIRELSVTREGTFTLPFLAPNLQINRQYYERCWDVSNIQLIDLASIRQKFIDQGQSTNIYFSELTSAKQLLATIFYAEKLGLKSLYYLNTKKAGTSEEACEGCSS